MCQNDTLPSLFSCETLTLIIFISILYQINRLFFLIMLLFQFGFPMSVSLAAKCSNLTRSGSVGDKEGDFLLPFLAGSTEKSDSSEESFGYHT